LPELLQHDDLRTAAPGNSAGTGLHGLPAQALPVGREATKTGHCDGGDFDAHAARPVCRLPQESGLPDSETRVRSVALRALLMTKDKPNLAEE